jgi:hypothetical protein
MMLMLNLILTQLLIDLRMPIVDPQTGQMDLRYNQLSNDQDYFIPVK